jgi:cadmium resistance protein CadD (predicted permease)
MEIYVTVIVAILAFLATNVDDILILMSFFAINDNNNVEVVIGQYIGFILIISLCLFSYFFKIFIPPTYLPLLGIFPILIGLKYLWNYRRDIKRGILLEKSFGQPNDDLDIKSSSFKKIFHVAAVTVSNSGDNLGVYIPLYLSLNIIELGITTTIFLIMTGSWCVISYLMVNNEILGKKISMYGHIIFPIILIVIGLWIL